MIQQGVYLCEYMDSWEKLAETKLPPKNAFYIKPSMKGISDTDYEHAQQVWNRITPELENLTLEDYHDIYLEIDVLPLVDVMRPSETQA